MLMNIRQCRSFYLLKPSVSNLLSIRLRNISSSSSSSSLSSDPLFSSHSPQIVFSGIQPTGVPHIGNYLGALQEWVRFQNEAPATSQLFFSIVDLHALTDNASAAGLKQWKRQTLATLLAVGLDPKRSTIFYQSSVPAHTELMWVLSCTASVGYLSRMTQWKSKLGISDDTPMWDVRAKSKLKLGLFTYPVLQAADVLLYQTTHVPVGQDQAQHIEFARECANNFNAVHGQVLVKPQTIISPAKRIMSLNEPHLKMSKSHHDPRSRILITDHPDEIKMKLKLALTDCTTGLSYDLAARPGVSNLLTILAHFTEPESDPRELARRYASLSMREFKDMVAANIAERLSGIRARYEDLMKAQNASMLEETANEGARKARERAAVTMAAVKEAIGL